VVTYMCKAESFQEEQIITGAQIQYIKVQRTKRHI